MTGIRPLFAPWRVPGHRREVGDAGLPAQKSWRFREAKELESANHRAEEDRAAQAGSSGDLQRVPLESSAESSSAMPEETTWGPERTFPRVKGNQNRNSHRLQNVPSPISQRGAKLAPDKGTHSSRLAMLESEPRKQGKANLCVKAQTVNILSLTGHMVSVTMTRFCHGNVKAALDNMEMIDSGSAPMKLLFTYTEVLI